MPLVDAEGVKVPWVGSVRELQRRCGHEARGPEGEARTFLVGAVLLLPLGQWKQKSFFSLFLSLW